MGITRVVFQMHILGMELFKAVLLIAFNDLKVHRIEAEIEEKNKRSIISWIS